MDFSYLITPFFTWLITGCTKFTINSIKAKKFALDQIGYGGFPSNHSAIVSSTAALIGLKEGINHPAFGIAMAFAFIVILDAKSLRQQVGKHAVAINSLNQNNSLRERVGHTPAEILGGILVGIITAWGINELSLFWFTTA